MKYSKSRGGKNQKITVDYRGLTKPIALVGPVWGAGLPVLLRAFRALLFGWGDLEDHRLGFA